jgi:CheY-like chemotaxis protein/HPt (histidine-containing phosphotransfer) domain-containing protein
MAKIRRRLLFELKIVLAILLTIITVLLIGWKAYRSMGRIIDELSEEARPDRKLVVLKDIESDLLDAESSVRAYSIAGTGEYLEPFYESALSMDEKINLLYQLNEGLPQHRTIIDSMNLLIEQKFIILNEFLLLVADNRVEETLDKISQTLKEAEQKKLAAPKGNNSKKSETSSPELPRSNIITRIFGSAGKNKKQVPVAEEHTTAPEEEQTLQLLQSEIIKIKKEEEKESALQAAQELQLTQQDKEVMDKIRALTLELETLERQLIEARKVEAERMVKEANLLIALFCLTVSILLFILGYVLISYTRKNAAYSRALRKAKTEAENLAQVKESFLSNMSHEIRTPMNAIAGFTDQLLTSPLDREQQKQLGIIKKSVEHLINILNDILDFSKLGAGKLELEHIGFSFGDLLEEVVAMMQLKASAKKIALSHEISATTPDVLIGDPMRLKQILLNLVSNAIKFTDAGEVAIEAGPIQLDEKNVRLKITVRDTGIGIAPAEQKRIFNEFEQAKSSITRRYGGTGLGLTITRKLILLQEGTIRVESEVGKGTSVILELPYDIGTAQDISESLPFDGEKNRLPAVRVLVADDEEYNRMLLTTILRKWDLTYSEAADGREALEELSRNVYDIVLMDIQMPVMNGLEAVAHLRSIQNKVPVLALTASTSRELLEACKEAGINDVLRKPFKERQLYEKMALLLEQAPEPVDPMVAKSTKPSEGTESYDLSEIIQMANGDAGFVKEMVAIFIKTTRQGMEGIRSGIEEEDWDKVAHYSHKIAAPCQHIEAYSIYQMLKDIEEKTRRQQTVAFAQSIWNNLEDAVEVLLEKLEGEVRKLSS